MKPNRLSVIRLRELLEYDAMSGVFTWRINKGARAFAGEPAGCGKPGQYVVIGIDRVLYASNKLAWLYMTGDWPLHPIGHIDTDHSNNRWSNLHLMPGMVAQQTRRRPNSGSASQFLGVHWRSDKRRWQAMIRLNYIAKHLGYFKLEADAGAAYVEAKRALHVGCTL